MSRNAQGAGTIRQRKDGRWEARYTIGRDGGTGKQIQKSLYGKTQKEVSKKLRQVTLKVEEGEYIEPSKLTVGKWLSVWLNEYIGNVKPLTAASYRSQYENHIKPALGAVKLTALNTDTIQKFYNNLQRKKGLSPKTIKNIHGVLHKSLEKAAALQYINYNPSNACELPKVIKKEIKPLDEKDIKAFINAVAGHEYETLYIVTLFTGMRQGEILGLTWDNIDFDRGTIYINKQLQKEKTKNGKYYLATLKNDKTRTITPAPYIINLLSEHRKKQSALKQTAGSIWGDHDPLNDNLVFTNEIGCHLVHVTVYKQYKKIVESIGCSSARFHDLRHSYAVASLQNGDDIKTVQENLGHHTAAFTLDVYGHVSERMKKESAARMEAYIKSL